MKNYLLSFIVLSGFAACNNSPKEDNTRDIQLLTDSTAYHNNIYSDTASNSFIEPVHEATSMAQPRVITRTKIIYKPVKATAAEPVHEAPVYTPPVAAPAPAPANLPGNSTGDNTVQTTGTGNDTQEGTATTIPAKKKGWSSAAKGAAIGAGAGAIGGAVLAKKKGLGAIVGGVVGAAGGYIIGKDIDKRNNRLIAY